MTVQPSELLVHCLLNATIALCGYVVFGIIMLIKWLM